MCDDYECEECVEEQMIAPARINWADMAYVGLQTAEGFFAGLLSSAQTLSGVLASHSNYVNEKRERKEFSREAAEGIAALSTREK